MAASAAISSMQKMVRRPTRFTPGPRIRTRPLRGPRFAGSHEISGFCLAAWQLFGPSGVYRRQMLEAY